jgi:hypothetical protein
MPLGSSVPEAVVGRSAADARPSADAFLPEFVLALYDWPTGRSRAAWQRLHSQRPREGSAA